MEVSAKVDSTSSSTIIPKEYLRLIRDSTRLSFDKTVTNKTRNPIVQLSYDKKYRINIYKITTNGNLQSVEIITTQNALSGHRTYHITYTPLDEFDNYEISYKSGLQDAVKNVYVDFNRGEILTIKNNDTVKYFYAKANNFSIRYQIKAAQDFFIGSRNEDSQTVISTEIMLLKHDHELYLILLTSRDLNTEITPGTLSGLINE